MRTNGRLYSIHFRNPRDIDKTMIDPEAAVGHRTGTMDWATRDEAESPFDEHDEIAKPEGRRGCAVDVVCVRRHDGRLACSEWGVRFGVQQSAWSKKVSRAYDSMTSGLSRLRASYSATQRRRRALRERTTDFSDDEVNEDEDIDECESESPPEEPAIISLLVNDSVIEDVTMAIERDGSCAFVQPNHTHAAHSLRPTAEQLESCQLRPGLNSLRIELRRGSLFEVARARCFLWERTDPVVVCDIDGTVTRTDVRGFIDSLVNQAPSVAHPGVCAFFEDLARDANVLYLTSRPIVLADMTRTYLAALEQPSNIDTPFNRLSPSRLGRIPSPVASRRTQHASCRMPDGPVITSRENIVGAIYSELVAKTPDIFKTKVLRDVNNTYEQLAFKAGFGNRITDCRAYARAGIATDAIFMIDPESRLAVPFAPNDARPTFHGYVDSRLRARLYHILESTPSLRPLISGRMPTRSVSISNRSGAH